MLDVDLFGGILGGEVVVFFQLGGGHGPGVVGGGAGLIELDELFEVGVGDWLVFGQLLRGLALVEPDVLGAAFAFKYDYVGLHARVRQEDAGG